MSNRTARVWSLLSACAAFASLAPFASPASAAPAPVAPDACAQALAYEKTASSDTLPAQGRYDATVTGLAANQRCADAQMKLVNEAYLLSMRAPAEHDLKIGDWQRDYARANALLSQCAAYPGLKGSVAGKDCADQRRYNELIAKKLAAKPTPAPAPSAPASAAPAMPAAPAPSASPRP